jgi:tetratricopeptide (TPR) repeat protein
MRRHPERERGTWWSGWRTSRLPRSLATLGITALVLFNISCNRHEPSLHFSGVPVILISVDTLRSDHLPAYGYKGVETPAIDALARDSMLFEHAWSHCPMTLPSHLTMLTGQLPADNGVRNNLGYRFDAAHHPSVPSLLKARGYATGAAVSSYVLRGDTGMRAMFDFYEDTLNPPPGAAFADYQRSGAITTSLAETWIDAHASQPFFFFLHLYEPHVPYDPPEPFRSRFKNPYDGEIANADSIVGGFIAFLKQRGIYDRAIVVFTSDHGEGLGDHGEQQHSILLYREAIQIPLLLKLPQAKRGGERIAEPAALVDIARTIADLTDVDLKTTSASSLLALPKTREVYSETLYPYLQLGWSDLRSMVSDRVHYIDSSQPELYALADARERTNIINDDRRTASALRAAIGKFPAATAATTAVDAETAAKLAALGYVGALRNRPDPRSLPNPREAIRYLDAIQEGFHLAEERRFDEAIARLRAIVQANPRMTDVWVKLAQTYAQAGDNAQALDAYRNAIGSAGVFSPEIAVMMGDLELQSGKVDDAERAARAALSATPEAANELLARVALARKDFATAESLSRSLPPSPAHLVLLGEALDARGDLAGALAVCDRARAAAQAAGIKNVQGVESLRGDLLARNDKPREAVAAFENEIANFPHNQIAYARLALLHFVTGDRARFEEALRRLVTANPTPAARELAAKTRREVGAK